MRTRLCLLVALLFVGCSDDTSKNNNPDPSNVNIGTQDMSMSDSTPDPDGSTADTAIADAGEDSGSGLTEGQLAACEAGDDCIVVPYSHCCGSTRRAINAANQAEYEAHPEWQEFNDPDACAVIGACMDDTHLNAAECDVAQGQCVLVSACQRMFACDPAAVDLTTNVAATQQECEGLDANGALPAGLRSCIDAAADCDAIAECVNCRDSFASEFCRDTACPFAVDECLFAADEGQCTIDCDNITGGAVGCFPGYEITCWEDAVEANDCGAASGCFRVY